MNDDRAREAIEHLQAAALQLIAAARAVLDVAEEAVQDPAALTSLLQGVVAAATRPSPGGEDREPGVPRRPPVTRIKVS